MFTGIVTHTGRVASLEKRGDLRLTIETDMDLAATAIGASIACSGVCLTVVAKHNGGFAADVSAESLACTNIGDWQVGTRINLEKSLKVGEELGGHIVSGHVDGVVVIEEIIPEGDSHRFTFGIPERLARYVAVKGSICLNGVSLTVNDIRDEAAESLFTVNIIPHTLQLTAFCDARPGDQVNVEVDILSRYIDRLRS